jgi:formylglycine-generating enzyme required for sulfatase activity
MNFVEGMPLDQFVESAGLTMRAFISLFAKIARAIHEAHVHGIIHRDLKPSNVLVDARGEPHVMDFGLARIDGAAKALASRSAHTVTGQILGSLQWASPEIIDGRGSDVDGRSDVYSLGVVLYRSLCGEWPYDISGPITQIFENILSRQPVPLLSTRKRWRVHPPSEMPIDVGLDATVACALAKQVDQRQPTAAAFADELEGLLDGHVTRKRPKSKLHRRRDVLLSAMLVTATLGGAAAWWKVPRPPRVLLSPAFTNSVGISFVKVPPGRFAMGSAEPEEGRDADERRHFVSLTKPFLLAQTEMTCGQYFAVMKQLPPGVATEGKDAPVDQITWDEASEFCRRLSAVERKHYRLPTEAEWEYACRAGTIGSFSGEINHSAWYAGNSSGRLHPVGIKWQNPFGLYDMHGGVAEWCHDWYSPFFSQMTGEELRNPEGPSFGSMRVIRGGNVFTPAARCRSAARFQGVSVNRIKGVGFRIALDYEP